MMGELSVDHTDSDLTSLLTEVSGSQSIEKKLNCG
jgi:hypothetical protein